MYTKFYQGKRKGIHHSQHYTDMNGMQFYGLHSSDGPVAGNCEKDNEIFGSIKNIVIIYKAVGE
jgi:hypothetical protein